MKKHGSGHIGVFGLSSAHIAQGLLLAAFIGLPLAAQAAPSTDELDQRIKILERQLEIQKEEADAKAKEATSTSIGDKGLSIKKGDFELKFRGVVQSDARIYLDDSAPRSNDSFLFRRIRPTIEGTFGKLVGFRLTPEFTGNGSGEAASIVDAYIDLKFDPAYTLRAGKVKGPVSLERLQAAAALSFVERGFPTELAPNRDLGVQLQGDLFNSTVNYTLGYYNGTPDGRDITGTDVDNRKEVGARLFFEPFKNELGFFQGLGFGIGSSLGTKDQGSANAAAANSFLPRYRTPSQAQFFSYRTAASTASASAAGTTGVYADGDHLRLSPQLYFYRNSFGLLAEYISSEQDLAITNTAAGPGAVTAFAESLENTAWQAAVTYVLTGEDSSFRGVTKPANPFTLGGPGWGAFELALRHGELEIDEDAFPIFANPNSAAQKASSYTVGVNWYLNTNVKAVVNYTNTEFDGGAAAGADREEEKTVFARLQLAF
ncbi:MAG: OprO/OprP family phosphate-selective porin [Panacagrimonas sp.]